MQKAYEALIAEGKLKPDAAQAAVVARLHVLAQLLSKAEAKRAFGFFRAKKGQMPRGLYLWGDVGRGKSLLMDMFHVQVKIARKRRVHFNEFMQDVHGRVHRLRAAHAGPDVLGPVAEEIARETKLLCLDEFQVEDITDAMILGRLFQGLLDRDVCVILTSNTPPNALYRDGLNRQLFLPFIKLIESRLDVVSLASPHDYRLGRLQGEALYITPPDPQAMEKLWQGLTDGEKGKAIILKVKGRELQVPRAAHGVAWFSFAQLCEAALGTADYAALADNFSTIFLSDLPVLTAKDKRNEARRFTLLIDTLYDRRKKLVLSAKKPAEAIGLMPRTLSRLQEMGSEGWWNAEEIKKNAKS